MKAFINFSMIVGILFSAMTIIPSCNKEEENVSYYQSYLNGTYANHADTKSNILVLMYNGNKLPDKEVDFNVQYGSSGNQKAIMNLRKIIPNENETVIPDVQLHINDYRLMFEGSITTKGNSNVSYSGYITSDTLSLNLQVR